MHSIQDYSDAKVLFTIIFGRQNHVFLWAVKCLHIFVHKSICEGPEMAYSNSIPMNNKMLH